VALDPASGLTKAACAALGVSRASVQRRRARLAAPPVAARPRRKPARALTGPQQQAVVDLLHAPRFADQAPAEVYASLLDEGVYHCSIRTMYRILDQNDEVRERRQQLRHPVYQKPELLAERPNQVWSWDITKLMGPTKWSYFYLYVILDIFSRRVVGWCVADAESAVLFRPLFDDAVAKHKILPGQLTLHADRGGPMKAKATAFLLADLGVTRSHNRPHTSNDNPFSESHFKTPKYQPTFPPTLWLPRGRQDFLPRLLRLVQPGPSPQRHRPDDTRPGAFRTGRCRSRRASAHARSGVPGKPGALRQQNPGPTCQTDRGLDQSANAGTEGPDLNAEPGLIAILLRA
jgi:transposase InsO family protein